MTQVRDDLAVVQEQIRLAPGRLIGSRIRKARRAVEGLSHDKLAATVGTSRSHLIKLEKSLHRPGATLLLAIADATGKPLDFFLVEEAGEPNPFPEDEAA